jgi:hypothetical protein
VKTYIILPSTIYGFATGKLVDIGVQHPYSRQIPTLIKASLARGQAAVVGEGKNIWPHVYINESEYFLSSLNSIALTTYLVADLYIILYDSAVSNPATSHGRAGFYFGENGEYTLYEVSKAISEAMLALGKGKTLEPTPFTEEEYKRNPGVSRL